MKTNEQMIREIKKTIAEYEKKKRICDRLAFTLSTTGILLLLIFFNRLK